VVFVP